MNRKVYEIFSMRCMKKKMIRLPQKWNTFTKYDRVNYNYIYMYDRNAKKKRLNYIELKRVNFILRGREATKEMIKTACNEIIRIILNDHHMGFI